MEIKLIFSRVKKKKRLNQNRIKETPFLLAIYNDQIIFTKCNRDPPTQSSRPPTVGQQKAISSDFCFSPGKPTDSFSRQDEGEKMSTITTISSPQTYCTLKHAGME